MCIIIGQGLLSSPEEKEEPEELCWVPSKACSWH